MYIHFIVSKYGVYGGGLDEPFTHLGRALADRFQAEQITFPYQEIEIQLAQLSPSVKEAQYLEWYRKLPIYYRGKNMVRVILPVKKTEKTLAYVFEQLYNSFDIVISKQKKSDVIDGLKIKSVLFQFEQELKASDLWELHSNYKSLLRQETIERNRQERLLRSQNFAENMRLIYDLRFYCRIDNDVDKSIVMLYGTDLCDRILGKLRKRKFKLPGYTHIYVLVSDSFENALYHATRCEKWYAYGLAVLYDYATYAAMSEQEKERTVFNLLWQGLIDLANNDHLDIQTLQEVLNEIDQEL